MDTRPMSNYRPVREHRLAWTIVIVGIPIGVLVGIAFGLLTMIPTNTRFKENTQAKICHNNLVRVQKQIGAYYTDTKQYPPAGKIGKKSPLITDEYLKAVPHCPTTGHEYLIQVQEGQYVPVCDSGLAGHHL
jgi:competence protein ComGC